MISCFTLEMSRTTSCERPSNMSSSITSRLLPFLSLIGKQEARALREQTLAQFHVIRAAAEEPRDGKQLDRRQRHEVVRAEEDVELGGVEPADRAVVHRKVEDGEEVPVVDVVVDLRPLALREDVFDVEGMPAEALGEPLRLVFRRRVDVDPRQPARLELGRAPPRSGRRDGDVAWAARASDTGEARHRDSGGRRSRTQAPYSPSYLGILIDQPRPARCAKARARPRAGGVARARARRT